MKYQESGNNAEMKLDEDLDSDSSSSSVNKIHLNKEKTKKKKRMTQLAIQMIQRRKMRRNKKKQAANTVSPPTEKPYAHLKPKAKIQTV